MYAVCEDAAADHKHRCGAENRQGFHHIGRGKQNAATEAALQAAAQAFTTTLIEIEAGVIQLDDTRHQAINPDCHQQSDTRKHRDLLAETGQGHGAKSDGDDFCREDKVGADRAFDLVLLERQHVHFGVGHGLQQFLMLRLIIGLAVEELVREFLEAFVAEEGATKHQQRRYRPGRKGTDQQGSRHQNQLVLERALGHRPDHRQLPFGPHAADLLGVQRQVVAEYPGSFLGRHFGHYRHIVENGGDVIKQG